MAIQLHVTIGQSLAISKLKLESLKEALSEDEIYDDLAFVCQSLNEALLSSLSLTARLSYSRFQCWVLKRLLSSGWPWKSWPSMESRPDSVICMIRPCLMGKVPITPAGARAIQDRALSNPLLKGFMFSENGNALCLHLPLTH